MRNAYVYYRVAPAQAALAAQRIDALLDALREQCRSAPRRLVRCDDDTTWMEIYEGIADFAAFTAALEAAVRRAGCATFTEGQRHLECFVVPGEPRA